MREYSRVHWAFWSSETIRSMSEDGRNLSLYLLTCPHTNMLGVFRAPDAYVSEDLQWDIERVREGFRNASSKGFVTRDEGSGWLIIHGYLDYNPIENPNQGKGALKLLNALPPKMRFRPDVAQSLADRCMRFRDKLGDEFFNRLETLSEPFRNQEQEQEQEQDSTPSGVEVPPQREVDESETPVVQLQTCEDQVPFMVTKSIYEECVRLYPAVDVAQELRSMQGHLISCDRHRRPTPNHVKKFIHNWLKKEARPGGGQPHPFGDSASAFGQGVGKPRSTRSRSIEQDLTDTTWAN